MRTERFDPALQELLDDPITHLAMASDRVRMETLLRLLGDARDRLRAARQSLPEES